VQIERKTIEVESYLTADDLGRAASLGAPGMKRIERATGTSNANRDTWRAKAAISAVSALESGHSLSNIPRFSYEFALGSMLTRVSENTEVQART